MTTAYTSLLGLALPVTGELSGTWGDTVNNSITSLLDSAIAGTTTISSDADVTLTTTTGAANTSREAILLWTAGGTATRTITAPAQSKTYIVINKTSSTQSIKLVGVGPTTGVTIIAGESAVCAWNGLDFIKVSNISGAGVFSSITNTGLTSGRVVYSTTGGLETDSANLLYSGTDLTVYGLTVGRGAGAISTNTAVGAGVLATNTTGSSNTAIGYQAFQGGTTASNNTAVGYQASFNTTGNGNSSYGVQAFYTNTTGVADVAIGQSALFANTTGSYNTALGRESLYSNTTASNNTAVGYQAGYTNTTNPQNTFVGYTAGYSSTGGYNSAFGYQAGNAITSGSSNTALGRNSMSSGAGVTGSNNTSVGDSALLSLTSGASNVAIGLEALKVNTTASNNTAVGTASLLTNTTGASNSAVGVSSLRNNTTASDNVAFGVSALESNTTGASNTAVGRVALFTNTTGANNIGVGSQALYSNTTTSNNTAVGYQAGYASTASTCTFMGYVAGSNLATGTSGTYIGGNATASSTSVDRELVICTGGGGTGKGSSTGFINPNSGGVYQGNNSSSWSTTSDFRLKKNIVDNTEGLYKITAIRVRNFEYKLPEEVTELDPSCAVSREGVQLGVIAQELREVCPDCVKEESTGVISVDSDNIFWHMVNAIKDLKALVDAQATEITALKAKVGI